MQVNWKYDLLFSFQVFHSLTLNPGDFSIYPTQSCIEKLKKYNLIFKPSNNGGLVIAEKRVLSDDTIQALRKISDLTLFTFILKLKKPLLLSSLSPYSSNPEDALPDFFGRNRLLYFDNLDNNFQPDQNLSLVSAPELQNIELSHMDLAVSGTTGLADLASLVPNEFSYHRKAGVSQLVLRPQSPNAGNDIVFNLTDQKPVAELSLIQGAYQLEQIGSDFPTELIFAGSEVLSTSLLAVLSIYKNEITDYNMAIRYNINFEEPQNTN